VQKAVEPGLDIVVEIKGTLHSLHRWQCIHASRDANTATHTLAKLAKLGIIDKIWMEEAPDCICDILLREQRVLSV
jgi:hypothetical protein